MTRAYQRSWQITLGQTRIESADPGRNELAVKFEITKSTKREPNTATVRVANILRAKRREFEEMDEPQIEIIAGYKDYRDTIFVGDARDIWSEKEGADIWTTFEAEDGGRSYRTAEIEQSFGESVPVITVLRACTDAMGVGLGNAQQVIASAELDTAGDNFAGGVVLSGQAWRQLDRICRSCSLRWSIQNGVLQLRQSGRPSETTAIRLSPDTGLIGSPTRGAKDERTGKVSHAVKAMLIPGLYPGRVVQVASSELEGDFMIRRVSYVGDSSGPDWYADLECEEYDAA